MDSLLGLDRVNSYRCDQGVELGGRLGLKETLATGAITANMNDVAVFQSPSSSGAAGTINGAPLGSNATLFALGQFSTQIDFTITAGISGGPNWVLSHFKGPNAGVGSGSTGGSGGSTGSSGNSGSTGGSSSGGSGSGGGGSGGAGGSGGTSSFANFNRQTKDTVIITFIPVCIRQEDFPEPWLEDPTCWKKHGGDGCTLTSKDKISDNIKKNTFTYPIEYVRWNQEQNNYSSMGVGTPGWANYLPPCNTPQGAENRADAPARGFSTNLSLQGIQTLQSLQLQ